MYTYIYIHITYICLGSKVRMRPVVLSSGGSGRLANNNKIRLRLAGFELPPLIENEFSGPRSRAQGHAGARQRT